MCDKAFHKSFIAFFYILDRYKTQEMCDRITFECYKTQKMFDKAFNKSFFVFFIFLIDVKLKHCVTEYF